MSKKEGEQRMNGRRDWDIRRRVEGHRWIGWNGMVVDHDKGGENRLLDQPIERWILVGKSVKMQKSIG